MRITSHGHSCITVTTVDGAILLDPGSFSQLTSDDPPGTVFDGVDAVLITHQHPDHVHSASVLEAVLDNPTLEVFAPKVVALGLREQLPPASRSQVRAVAAGADFTAGGIQVRALGGTHATIHHSIELVANLGYVLGQGEVFHPGDSYQVPVGLNPQVLLLPVMAPWAKMAEAVDFAVATGAKTWVPIHDGLLNERGLELFDRQIGGLATAHERTYRRLTPGVSYTIEDLR